MSDDGQPYVVPLSYGYKDNTFYLHSASEGRKLDILRKNDRVCIEIDNDCEIQRGDDACAWSMKYRCVIGFGRASFIDNDESKKKAFDVIMDHYSEGSHNYTEKKVKNTVIIKIDIEEMTGKQSGY